MASQVIRPWSSAMSSQPVSLEQRVDFAQARWTEAVLGQDAEGLLELYTFPVQFKPTLADEVRTTPEGALSYFIGGDPAFPSDEGFLLKNWQALRWERKALNTYGDRAVDMGHYWFTDPNGDETKVDYTFGYVMNPATGQMEIDLHHSSLSYDPAGAGIKGWSPLLIAGAVAGAALLLSKR